MMPTVLITGAARGLGLEFARQYNEAGWDVVATARQSNADLDTLGITVQALDVSDFAAVHAFGAAFDRPLDLLIANAGIATPFEARSLADAEAWVDTFRVNSIAPVLLAEALRPRLEEAKGKAIAISSQMGSIADASTGWIPYRASKAALNMAWHALANEWRDKGIAMATLHPGWVQTDMGGPNATTDIPSSISGMRTVIDGLTIDRTGSFISFEGRSLPW
jgi:NAD(P)-dependent dehydrogenase (short-subunit alcohol dehydrogenase family)